MLLYQTLLFRSIVARRMTDQFSAASRLDSQPSAAYDAERLFAAFLIRPFLLCRRRVGLVPKVDPNKAIDLTCGGPADSE
jgi:hypothetical protein